MLPMSIDDAVDKYKLSVKLSDWKNNTIDLECPFRLFSMNTDGVRGHFEVTIPISQRS